MNKTLFLAGSCLIAMGASLRLSAQGEPEVSFPADAYSRPKNDIWNSLETLSGVSLGGANVEERAKAFHRNELGIADRDGVRWAVWGFQLKADASGFVGLEIGGGIPRRPESFSVLVSNSSKQAVSLSLTLSEIPWRPKAEGDSTDWVILGQPEVPAKGRRTVTFSLADAKASQPVSRTSPVFPSVCHMEVVQAKALTDYSLAFREFAVLYPDPQGISVTGLELPSEVVPGQDVAILISGQLSANDRCIDIEFRDESWVIWRVRLSEKEKADWIQTGQVALTRTAPWYLPSRDLTAGVVDDGYRVPGSEARVKPAPGVSTTWPMMERKTHAGRPTVFLEGQPFPWSGYATYDFQPGNVGEFGASGANVFAVPTNAGSHVHNIGGPTWLGDESYDFGQLDERICMALQANPEAYLILRVSLGLPRAWFQGREDLQTRVRTDQGDLVWEETGSVVCSPSSKAWRDQVEVNLRAMLQHCAAQPWCSRIISVLPTFGVTEEWFSWGGNDGFYSDYSPSHEAAFVAWCQAKGLPFSSIPNPPDRKREGFDIYPADGPGKASASFARYSSERVTETLIELASFVKRETQNRLLVGSFAGYLIQLAGEPRQHTGGHFALRALLDHPDVDYVVGVPCHNGRNLTRGVDAAGVPRESIQDAGKLYVDENDLFSWLHQGQWYTEYDQQDPEAGAISMHRRNLADDVIHGSPRQWFSLFASWHHDPGLQAEFSKEIQIAADALSRDRTPAEEVAFVVDDTSFAWIPADSKIGQYTHPELLKTFCRTGAPVGVWLMSDLDRLPSRIRFVVIAGGVAPLPRDLAKLKALIRAGDRTFLVVGPIGLVNPESMAWNVGATADLTGLPVVVDFAPGPGAAQLFDNGPEFKDLPKVCPRARIQGQGFLNYSDGTGAGAFRDLPNRGRLIWVGAPPNDSQLARKWLEDAGVHCYAPVDYSVYASRDLVSITAPIASGDPVEIRWPQDASVRDIFDGWTGSGRKMKCPFDAGQTRLFEVKLTAPTYRFGENE